MFSPQCIARELRGYIGCPVAGTRWNEQIHPWTKRPCVDLLHFQANSEEGCREAVQHFFRFGYVWWSGGLDCSLASLLLPRLDISNEDELHLDEVLSELTLSVERLRLTTDCSGQRALRAVLCLDRLRSETAEAVLRSETPLAAAIDAHRSTLRHPASEHSILGASILTRRALCPA